MATNICNLPESEQRDLHLARKASLLINELRLGRTKRADINRAIDDIGSDKERFRFYLNKYKG